MTHQTFAPQYIVMRNQSGLPCRWIVTDELENMYEVVCERDKSLITHVGKDKVCWTSVEGGCDNPYVVTFKIANTVYVDRVVNTSNDNGNFAFTSLGLTILLDC